MNNEDLFQHLSVELKKIDSEHEAQWIVDWIETQKSSSPIDRANDIIDRRKKNEPLAYIFGSWAFRDLELAVGPGVLIPRPETEELIDVAASQILSTHRKAGSLSIADLGAGSGAIGIALTLELRTLLARATINTTMVEASTSAHKHLKKNLGKYFPERKLQPRVFEGNWNDWASTQDPETFDIVISNPPYIAEEDWKLLDTGVRNFEPKVALVPNDSDPKDVKAINAYREIITISKKVLKSGGLGVFEMGTQAEEVKKMIESDPAFDSCEIHFDIAGKKRFISYRKG